MANKIIEEAFVEGRSTEVEWDVSDAKKNQDNLNIALHNGAMFGSKLPHAAIPLQRIDPITNKVVGWHPNRLDAAKWICENVLERPDKNPLSITGNMEMCMRAGWKSYGFRWKMVTSAEYQNHLLQKDKSGGNKVFVHSAHATLIYPSINATARALKMHHKTVRAICNGLRPSYKGKAIRWCQPSKVTVRVKSVSEASRIWGVCDRTADKMVESGEFFNNVKIKVV